MSRMDTVFTVSISFFFPLLEVRLTTKRQATKALERGLSEFAGHAVFRPHPIAKHRLGHQFHVLYYFSTILLTHLSIREMNV